MTKSPITTRDLRKLLASLDLIGLTCLDAAVAAEIGKRKKSIRAAA